MNKRNEECKYILNTICKKECIQEKSPVPALKRKVKQEYGFSTPKKDPVSSSQSKKSNPKKLNKYITPEKKIIRTPGFAFNSIHHKRIIENYQSVLFSPEPKKRKLLLTPELKQKVENNRLRAIQIQQVDRLLKNIKNNTVSSSNQVRDFTNVSNFVNTQDVANGLKFLEKNKKVKDPRDNK